MLLHFLVISSKKIFISDASSCPVGYHQPFRNAHDRLIYDIVVNFMENFQHSFEYKTLISQIHCLNKNHTLQSDAQTNYDLIPFLINKSIASIFNIKDVKYLETPLKETYSKHLHYHGSNLSVHSLETVSESMQLDIRDYAFCHYSVYKSISYITQVYILTLHRYIYHQCDTKRMSYAERNCITDTLSKHTDYSEDCLKAILGNESDDIIVNVGRENMFANKHSIDNVINIINTQANEGDHVFICYSLMQISDELKKQCNANPNFDPRLLKKEIFDILQTSNFCNILKAKVLSANRCGKLLNIARKETGCEKFWIHTENPMLFEVWKKSVLKREQMLVCINNAMMWICYMYADQYGIIQ